LQDVSSRQNINMLVLAALTAGTISSLAETRKGRGVQPFRFTISAIQMGANGDVQPLEQG